MVNDLNIFHRMIERINLKTAKITKFEILAFQKPLQVFLWYKQVPIISDYDWPRINDLEAKLLEEDLLW